MSVGDIVAAPFNVVGATQRRNAIKRAGTTLYQGAWREADTAEGQKLQNEQLIREGYDQAKAAYSPVANRSGDDLINNARQSTDVANAAAAQAGGYLDPYNQAGQRSVNTLSDLANAPQERFTGVDLTMDPSYQWRLQQGQEALQNSAAGRGGLQSGATLKALTNYAQGAASQEYQAAFKRSLDTFDANQRARKEQMDALYGVGALGERAGTSMGGYVTDAARLGGTWQQNAYERAGDWRNAAARQEGEWDIGSATDIARNANLYNDRASNFRSVAEQAAAGSQMGAGAATADMWSGIGQFAGGVADVALGDYSGSIGRKKKKTGGGIYDSGGGYIGE